jgi:hypothetical protein
MNHVTNHSPKRKRVFETCFAISMLVATMIITTYHCGNFANGKTGEMIEQHDAEVQSNSELVDTNDELKQVVIIKRLPVITSVPNALEGNTIIKKEKTESELEEHENIEEETETEVEATEEVLIERENTLYYMNEEGWKSYLDVEYQDFLYEMCIKYDVVEHYELFIAQMYHESTFRPNLISKTNDYGLMQINVCNHKYLERLFGFTDFLNPYVSIESGVYFMSKYLHKYNDVEKALVCYNKGENAVKNGTYSTTYSKGVLYDMNFLVELD